MAVSRSEQVAAFYALHARALEAAVARQVRDRETANDGCARAWEQLLARPDIDLDHRGVRWLQTVAVREGWRDAQAGADMQRLDAELHVGDETIGDVLVGRDPDLAGQIASAERLRLLDELSPDRRTAVLMNAAGLSYQEIASATGATQRKARRDLSRGRDELRELDRAQADRTPPRDPAALLQAARERHAELLLERHGAAPEQHDDLDRRLGNTAAAIRGLHAEVVERDVSSPPRWATALFGDRPPQPVQATAYDHGVREAARYRAAYGVRPGEARLGVEPMPKNVRIAFQRAETAVQATKRALGQRPTPLVSDVGRGAAGTRPRAGQLSLDAQPRDRGVDR